jgi:TorA maturation chaperone TorD
VRVVDAKNKALWLDFLSRAFAYPDQRLLEWLEQGGIPFLRAGIADPAGSIPAPQAGSLLREAQRLVAAPGRQGIESDYIALFELNPKQPPIRMYGGLYRGEEERLPLLQRLSALYREYGLELAEGAEQLDHLTVELEFLSFLYRGMGDPQRDEAGRRKLQSDIAFLERHLLWSREFARQLADRHPFYRSLTQLLEAILTISDEGG